MQRPPPQYSPDRQWWWDGYQWHPVGVARAAPGLFWFFETPDWIGPVVLTALIGLIPVAGTMVLFGWLLAARDNVRRGWLAVPPANFSYLERGVWIVVIALVYGLILAAVEAVLIGLLVAVVAAGGSGGVAVMLGVLAGLLFLGWTVVFAYLLAALICVTDRYGPGAGFNPARLWRAAGANAGNSWKVAGVVYLSSLVVAFVGAIPVIGWFLLIIAFLATPAIYLNAVPYLAPFDEAKAG